MLDPQRITENVEKARAVRAHLGELGCDDAAIGPLGADLSDLYMAAEHFRVLLDTVLAATPQDRARIAEALADLYAEVFHLRYHAESALPFVEAIAERFDD
jgi:hypothetical protein